MDWKEIPKKYTKCWKISKYNPILGIRQLYDFFDENNIIVELGVDYTMEPKYCFKVSEYIETEIDWEQKNPNWSDLYYTRTEAEQSAFEKAFEILETKLK